MNSALFYCVLSNINWMWFVLAAVSVFALGAVWYSVLFPKMWARVFKIDTSVKPTTGLLIRTMTMQIIVILLFGLALFVIAKVSVCIALLALTAFAGWEKGELNFQFSDFKEYWRAAIIRAGYTFLAGLIFILFAMI